MSEMGHSRPSELVPAPVIVRSTPEADIRRLPFDVR